MIDESAVLFQAGSYSSIGQHDRAITLLTDALAEEPDNPRLLVPLADLYLDVGRFVDAEDAVTSALASDPTSISANLTLAWVHFRRGRPALMTETAEKVLARDPQNASAHLYVAMGLAFGRGNRKRIAPRAREEYRAALAVRQTVGIFYWAAEIERRLGDRAEAKKLVSSGLEIDPTDVGLLKLRADQVATVEEKISILSGILAMNPFDRSSRSGLSEVYRKNRLSKYTLQWGLLFWLVLVAAFSDGLVTVVLTVVVWLVGLVAWGRKNNATAGIPAEFAAMRASSFRYKVLTANLSLWWFVATLLGSILLANDVGAGLFVLLVALAFWAASHSIIVIDDARNATRDSPLSEAPGAVPTQLRALADSRSGISIPTSFGLFLLSKVFIALGDGNVITAQTWFALAVLCAAVGLVYLLQGLVFVWSTKPSVWRFVFSLVRLAVIGSLLCLSFSSGMQSYIDSLPAGFAAPPAPSEKELTPEQLQRWLNPTPVPSLRMPTMPAMPSIPPIG